MLFRDKLGLIFRGFLSQIYYSINSWLIIKDKLLGILNNDIYGWYDNTGNRLELELE